MLLLLTEVELDTMSPCTSHRRFTHVNERVHNYVYHLVYDFFLDATHTLGCHMLSGPARNFSSPIVEHCKRRV